MSDFYFVYSVIDLVWKICSILFVLYRFTSFFSMIYDFFKFSGRLLKGLIYVKDQIVIYIRKRNNYGIEQYDLPIRQDSFFTKLYNKLFKKNENHTYLPLYETRTENANNNDYLESKTFNFKNRDSIQNDEFNKLLNSNSNMQESSDVFNSNYDINTNSSIYQSMYPPQKKRESFNVQESFNLLKSEFINNVLKINEEGQVLEESDESDSLFKSNF